MEQHKDLIAESLAWHDVVEACKRIGYSPEDVLVALQLMEMGEGE